MPPRDPSLPEGTDHIIDTNIDLGDSGGGGSGGSSGGGNGAGGTTAGEDGGKAGSAFKFDQDQEGGGEKSDGIASGIIGQVKDHISSLKGQAGDRVRSLADDGKDQATSFLQSLADVLSDAAGSIEDKLGDRYAGPGRGASDSIRSLADRLDDSNVEDLLEQAKGFVQRSPVVAVGIAAVVGFAVARVLRSSIAEFRGGGQDDDAGSGAQAGGGTGRGAND